MKKIILSLLFVIMFVCLASAYNTNSVLCYQESANKTDYCGLDTGKYNISGPSFNNPDNMYDGNWETYGY